MGDAFAFARLHYDVVRHGSGAPDMTREKLAGTKGITAPKGIEDRAVLRRGFGPALA